MSGVSEAASLPEDHDASVLMDSLLASVGGEEALLDPKPDDSKPGSFHKVDPKELEDMLDFIRTTVVGFGPMVAVARAEGIEENAQTPEGLHHLSS